MMTDTVNSIVAFRCPVSFKERMKAHANARGQNLSTFIRSACAAALRSQVVASEPSRTHPDIGANQ